MAPYVARALRVLSFETQAYREIISEPNHLAAAAGMVVAVGILRAIISTLVGPAELTWLVTAAVVFYTVVAWVGHAAIFHVVATGVFGAAVDLSGVMRILAHIAPVLLIAGALPPWGAILGAVWYLAASALAAGVVGLERAKAVGTAVISLGALILLATLLRVPLPFF